MPVIFSIHLINVVQCWSFSEVYKSYPASISGTQLRSLNSAQIFEVANRIEDSSLSDYYKELARLTIIVNNKDNSTVKMDQAPEKVVGNFLNSLNDTLAMYVESQDADLLVRKYSAQFKTLLIDIEASYALKEQLLQNQMSGALAQHILNLTKDILIRFTNFQSYRVKTMQDSIILNSDSGSAHILHNLRAIASHCKISLKTTLLVNQMLSKFSVKTISSLTSTELSRHGVKLHSSKDQEIQSAVISATTEDSQFLEDQPAITNLVTKLDLADDESDISFLRTTLLSISQGLILMVLCYALTIYPCTALLAILISFVSIFWIVIYLRLLDDECDGYNYYDNDNNCPKKWKF